MLTGDSYSTAYSIAKELELTTSFDNVTTGNEVEDYLEKGEKDFDKFVNKLLYKHLLEHIFNSL